MSKKRRKGWGYASYDIDDPKSANLIYTRYEDTNSVNKYKNNGEEPDQQRVESNDSKNPDTGEVQESSGCYLTTACVNFIENGDYIFAYDRYKSSVLSLSKSFL